MSPSDHTADASAADAPEVTSHEEPGLVLVWARNRPAFEPWTIGRGLDLGREARGTTCLDDPRVSSRHASVSRTGGRWRIEDHQSHNGTYVDGGRVHGALELATARVIRVGDCLLTPVRDLARVRAHPPTVREGMVIGPSLAEVHAAYDGLVTEPAIHFVGEVGTGRRTLARWLHDQLAPGAPFIHVGAETLISPRLVAERVFANTATTVCVSDIDRAAPTALWELLAQERPRGVRLMTTLTHGRYRHLLATLQRRLSPLVTIPPLRTRSTEVPWLVEAVLARLEQPLPAHVSLVERALLALWPGNVPELQAALTDARTRASAEGSDVVRARHLAETAGSLRIDTPEPEHNDALAELTRREREVFTALLMGEAEKATASLLGLSIHTVHQHVKAVYRKLGVRSRGELLSRFVAR